MKAHKFTRQNYEIVQDQYLAPSRLTECLFIPGTGIIIYNRVIPGTGVRAYEKVGSARIAFSDDPEFVSMAEKLVEGETVENLEYIEETEVPEHLIAQIPSVVATYQDSEFRFNDVLEEAMNPTVKLASY